MSEGNVPPRNNDSDSLDSAARADQTPANPPSNPLGAQDDWEIVPLADMLASGKDPFDTSPQSAPTHGDRESDLQARIQDLNRCNEVLLTRVHQLEEALERSQQVRQQAMERSQRRTAEEKMATAQNHSVAELLRDLEQSNGALERQTILAETLAAQLQTFQERSEQLEQECKVLRQQHSEKTQQLQVAEEACADLRSRLQRQQRYTLQFKAALEKCLDTNAFQHTSSRIEAESASSSSAPANSSAHLNPQVMPRSERIQPWSASEPAAQADPHLLSLMRAQPFSPTESESAAAATHPFPTSLGETVPPPAASTSDASAAHPVEANPEAERQLWQDVERVVDTTAEAQPEVTAAEPSPQASPEEAQFTEPIPWGAPVQKETSDNVDETSTQATDEPQPAVPSPSADEPSVVTRRSPAPSPEDQAAHYSKTPDTDQPAAAATSIPALDAMKASQASPSPVVHPLRPTQRKRKSLSAVELPSFPPLPKVKH
jgi:hypothetical protein